MLSTFPATFPSETLFSDQLPFFTNDFPQWDSSQLMSIIQSPDTTLSYPPAADEGTPPSSNDSLTEERKRRRKKSNRESARRSRMRKQKQLENLTNHVNKLRYHNRELNSRLRFLIRHFHRLTAENDHLRLEQAALRERLAELNHFWLQRQMMHEQLTSTCSEFSWPCNSAIVVNTSATAMSEQIPSLITY